VGKNLANMELFLIMASLFRRYDFVLEDPDVKVCALASRTHDALLISFIVRNARGLLAQARTMPGWYQAAGVS
jgi:cytochrome P450